MINIVTVKSSEVAGGENNNVALMKRNRKLQRKITVLVTTDIFTWVPFMIVCAMHYTEYFDFSHMYRYFSIFFLPCNSIINPILILYDDIVEFLKKIAVRSDAVIPAVIPVNIEMREIRRN